MANPNQKPPAVGEQWDEARIEASLKNLKDLHIKLRELRSTIPKMHQRLSAPVTSANALSTNLKEATQGAVNEVNEYKTLATNTENTKILEHAKQSRKNSPKGIKPWRPRDEPDWLTPTS